VTSILKFLLLAVIFLPSLPAAQYILELTPMAKYGRIAQHGSVRPMLERRGAKVTGELITALNGYIVEAEEADLFALATAPGVARIYPVQDVYPATAAVNASQRIEEAWTRLPGGADQAGAGVKIAILDTGIDTAHPAFRGATAKVVVERSYERFNAGRAGFNSGARDVNGHGTASAMIAAGVAHDSPAGRIAGVAPAALLGNYRVLGDTNGGTTAGVIQAIDDAVADGMEVLNLSLGTAFALHPDQDPMVRALEQAAAQGVIVIVAAGNAGPGLNSISSPGTAPSAITVASHTADGGGVAWFSGRGPNLGAGLKPDVMAVGNQIYTADSTLRDGSTGYRTLAGTSLSAPVIAGMAAVLKAQRPGLTAAAYRSLIVNSASEFPGRVQETGAGRADLARAMASTVTIEPAYLKGAGVHPVTVRNLAGEAQFCRASNGASFTLDQEAVGVPVEVAGEGWWTLECDKSAPARLAYLGVPATAQIAGITVLQAPKTATRGTVVEFGVRVTDAAGFAFTSLGAPRITVASGSAQVVRVTWMQGVPDTFAVQVRVGAGENVIRLSGGPAAADVAITGL
jgi:hypothetical protein